MTLKTTLPESFSDFMTDIKSGPVDEATLAYQNLNPDQILNAVESTGLMPDGRFLALNSYENRVYRVGLEDADAIVVKFYRPHRWSDDAIREEHAFAEELSADEIPVVAPIKDKSGVSLHQSGAFRFALFPNRGGRPPELDDADHLNQLGRFLARIHLLGETRPFLHRPELSIDAFGSNAARFVLEQGFIPAHLEVAYSTLTDDLIRRIQACFQRAGHIQTLRLHGDCHPGNILWTDEGPHIVDLDDARSGPAVQDLWMFLSGDRADRSWAMSELLEGYEQFREFPRNELHLIEALRTLRMIHYHSWIARRWEDPAFPMAFPWFDTTRCWEQHVLDLREQAALMDEPPLTV